MGSGMAGRHCAQEREHRLHHPGDKIRVFEKAQESQVDHHRGHQHHPFGPNLAPVPLYQQPIGIVGKDGE